MRSLLGVVSSLSPSKMLFAPAMKQSACSSHGRTLAAAKECVGRTGGPWAYISSSKRVRWSHWGSNPGPAACKADVITTTPCDHWPTEERDKSAISCAYETIHLRQGLFAKFSPKPWLSATEAVFTSNTCQHMWVASKSDAIGRSEYLITAAEVEAPSAESHNAPRHSDAGCGDAADDVESRWRRLILRGVSKLGDS